jgi:oligoendopeptidase F
MRQKSVRGFISLGIIKGLITLGIFLFFSVFSECGAAAEVTNSSETLNVEQPFEKLNPDEVTTEWNDEYLFSSREDALKELETLKKKPEEINATFRPEFENLSGSILLDYLGAEKEFSKSTEVLYVYAYT